MPSNTVANNVVPTHDVVIMIPKRDELSGLEKILGVTFTRTNRVRVPSITNEVYTVHIGDIQTAVIFLNDQGESAAARVSALAISDLKPLLLILCGTAAGRADKVHIGSVIFSKLVLDFEESRVTDEQSSPRVKQHEAPEQLCNEAARFVERHFQHDRLIAAIREVAPDIESRSEIDLANPPVEVSEEVTASGNNLMVGPESIAALWGYDDRLRCVDMESGGLGGSARKATQPVLWVVVRGISDYGTQESKSTVNRELASIAAGVFVKSFLTSGLEECHPRVLRLTSSPQQNLSEGQFYTGWDAMAFVKEQLERKLGLSLSSHEPGRPLTLRDLAEYCVAAGADRDTILPNLETIRADYFTDKYLDYDYEYTQDLRGFLPGWSSEFHDILRNLAFDLEGKTVIDVGVGNGLELTHLFADAERVVGVDISEEMLNVAAEKFSGLETLNAPAENLTGVADASVDAYISLRTYQSRFFDVRCALREAFRVLKPNGVVVISIANGYIDEVDGHKVIVRGLLLPGKRSVDLMAPMHVGNEVYSILGAFGFTRLGLSQNRSDLYVFARKVASVVRVTSRQTRSRGTQPSQKRVRARRGVSAGETQS
jgi:SAM-dependent methyltransferase/nucleoside phosphorylase